jgi:hypothetical protein
MRSCGRERLAVRNSNARGVVAGGLCADEPSAGVCRGVTIGRLGVAVAAETPSHPLRCRARQGKTVSGRGRWIAAECS